MKTLALLLLVPFMAFSYDDLNEHRQIDPDTYEYCTSRRIDHTAFWLCMQSKDYDTAKWYLDHTHPRCTNDTMYNDLCRFYLAWRRHDERGVVWTDVDIDQDVEEFVEITQSP